MSDEKPAPNGSERGGLRDAAELRSFSVRDIMCPTVRGLSWDAPLSTAWTLLNEAGIHHAVVRKDGRLVGVVSDRDLLAIANCVTDRPMRVGRIMTRNVVTVDADASLGEAVKLLLDNDVHCLVVLDGETLIGIVTATDFLVLLREFLA